MYDFLIFHDATKFHKKICNIKVVPQYVLKTHFFEDNILLIN